VSTQLRLVETPQVKGRKAKPAPRRGRVTRGRARGVRWAADWRLDAQTRAVGREGVAAAKDALAQARRPEEPLSKAS
jgi:hypothetical protein